MPLPCMGYDIEFLCLLLLKTMQKYKELYSPSISIYIMQLIYWNLLSAASSSLKNKGRQLSFVRQLAGFQNSNVRISCYFSHTARFCYFWLPERFVNGKTSGLNCFLLLRTVEIKTNKTQITSCPFRMN